MKKKVILFFLIIFLILSVVPVVNFISGNKKLAIKEMYSVDFIIPYISKKIYPYGLNLFSDQVVIGKEEWLFLGDNYAKTITLARNGVDANYAKDANIKSNVLYDWNRFFSNQGVKDFKILVGPNKSSVYSEFLPGWIKLSSSNKIDMMMDATDSKYYIYPREVLLAAKQYYTEYDLYYKTDTHWNSFGGWIAFDYFMKELKKENPEINYNQSFYLKDQTRKSGGDLSSFLRLAGWLKDKQQVYSILPSTKINTKCKRYYTSESYRCLNNPEIVSQSEPLLVESKGSENNKKILWLRDSFGTAISPYMARSFSNIIQVHYHHLNREQLVDLVESFKPDYIFMTIVERDFDGGLPVNSPEYVADAGGVKFYSSKIAFYNDVEEKSEGFSISGVDPYLVYRLDRGVDGEIGDSVALNLICDNNEHERHPVDIQVFWKRNINDEFSENNSGKFSIAQGMTYFELGSVSNWTAARNIHYLRLDIEPASVDKCTNFNIDNLIVNKI